MKRFAKILYVLPLLLVSCYEKVTYSDVPTVRILDVTFNDNPAAQDSLIISMAFTDGDGNVGLSGDNDFFPPYNDFNVFIDSNDTIVTEENYLRLTPPIYKATIILNDIILDRIENNTIFFFFGENEYPVYGFNKEIAYEQVEDIVFECPNITSLGIPDGDRTNSKPVKIYNINEEGEFEVNVTNFLTEGVLVERIETSRNLLIDFFQKTNVSGDFEPIDFADLFNACEAGLFDARIPFFDPGGESGTFIYKLQSLGFNIAFADNEIMLKVQLIDRDLNYSNADSITFFLRDISR